MESVSDAMFDEIASYAAIVDGLRRLPRGSLLEWYSPHVSAALPCRAGWVDVMVDALAERAGTHWIWTIERPEARLEDIFGIHLMYDSGLFVYGDWAQARIDAAELVTPTAEHDLACDAAVGPLLDELVLMDPIPGRPGWHQRAVWSPEAVSRALHYWCREHADRADVEFRWLGEARDWWTDVQVERTLDRFRTTDAE